MTEPALAEIVLTDRNEEERCARWWAGGCGMWTSADSRSWSPGTQG
jgi:hypothetical protein